MSEEKEKPDKRREPIQYGPPIQQQELQEILERHRKWLESDGKQGEQAQLPGANLEEADLANARLSRANFIRANLRRANLKDAWLLQTRFPGAFLGEANLQGANAIEVNLHDAFLLEANLQGATLLRANLYEAFVAGANLVEANLFDADMVKADLSNADLRLACLGRVDLRGANLTETRLREADLQDANLSGVKGLIGGQFGGANVSGAQLPDHVSKFEGLDVVAETSKNARRTFSWMILACLYSWLTIATTTDARLLTNAPSSPLPVIGTNIPISWFYWVAPAILVCLYLYLHLYLHDLWRGLANLPAFFPDGRPLNERVCPWLLNELVYTDFTLLRKKRPAFSRLKSGISIFLAWWIVPGTLFLFWGRYLPRHDWIGTGLHVVFLCVSIMFGILSYRLARVTLRGQDWKPMRWQTALRERRVYAYFGGAVTIFAIFAVLSFGAIEGVRRHPVDEGEEVGHRLRELVRGEGGPKRLSNPDVEASDIRSIVPSLLAFFGYRAFADFTEVDVSTKPTNWTGQESEIVLVRGARLRGRDLRYALASRAFLVNADLREVNLGGADLDSSDMRGARVLNANLQAVDLSFADLRKANFAWTWLREARFHSAKLQGAIFYEADLEGADLGNADLRGTHLTLANLSGARLEDANLQGADLRFVRSLPVLEVKKAKGWKLAFYTDMGNYLQKLGLPPDHNEQVLKKLAELEKAVKAAGGK